MPKESFFHVSNFLFSFLTPERDDAGVERLRAGLGPCAVDAVADVALDRES